jgi:hypothetical protein
MKKTEKTNFEAGSRHQNEPRQAGSNQKDMLRVFNPNTHLCVSVKTLLRRDQRMTPNKDYQGVLRRDEICEEFRYDEHFTFVETVPQTVEKRNPQVFRGEFVTITRRDDGTYRPNFRPMKVGADFSVEKYAAGVANELLWALEGLIENGSVEDESK